MNEPANEPASERTNETAKTETINISELYVILIKATVGRGEEQRRGKMTEHFVQKQHCLIMEKKKEEKNSRTSKNSQYLYLFLLSE